MSDFRPILFIQGLFLSALGGAMLLPSLADIVSDNSDWQVFAASALVTGFTGLMLLLSCRGGTVELDMRQGFLLTTTSWVAISGFAALPFLFSSLQLDYSDAFFEAISGLTTTGSTVVVGLDGLPPGILLWRSLLQWIGGIGIIVMAVAMLPFLRVGGMHLFRTESSDRSDKPLPRVEQIAVSITAVYAALTAACAAAYWLAGMTAFEAINHAMTTLSTGGFSTSDASMGHFQQPSVQWIGTLFMALSALPFVLYVKMLHGHGLALFHDRQVRSFIAFVGCVIVALWAWLAITRSVPALDALRLVAFNVVSVVTTTGFATTDYTLWGSFAIAAFFFLTLVGGCTGSTSGGIKMFRFEIMALALREQMHGLVEPKAVFVPRYGQRRIGGDVMASVGIFMFLFFAATAVLAAALAALGLDPVTSLSGAATALANVGPGIGPIIGPAGNFASLPDSAKWLLAAGMLLGRLEIFTVLVLFTPAFWRG